MFKFLGTVDCNDIPDIVSDYLTRFNDQPDSTAEVVEFDGARYVQLVNLDHVLAVYGDEYVPREDLPRLYW